MDDAEVDTSDLVGIIVEQGDDAVGVVCFYGYFLGDFAFDGGFVHLAEIGIEERYFIIDGIYVATYADGVVADEAGLPGPCAADVVEVPAGVGHYDVWYELLVCGVGLGIYAGYEAKDAGDEDAAEVGLYVEFEAVERAEFVEYLCLKYQYLFLWGHTLAAQQIQVANIKTSKPRLRRPAFDGPRDGNRLHQTQECAKRPCGTLA